MLKEGEKHISVLLYLTMGSLFLDFPGHEEATEFYRDLNIEDATATTRYKVDGVTYIRRVFASFTDSVIVLRLQADKAGALAFTVSYDAPLKHESAPKETCLPSLVREEIKKA